MKTSDEYEELRKKFGFAGFASRYSQTCLMFKVKSRADGIKSKLDDKIDIEVYTKLVQLDSNLGTTASEQLLWLLQCSLRLDLLKV